MIYGMTPDQFWNQDCHLAKYYREAYDIRRELENEAAWWQGVYFSEAVSAALYGRKAKYPTEPHLIKTAISKEREEARQEQNERKVVDYFMTFTKQFNERFAKKQQEMGSAGK